MFNVAGINKKLQEKQKQNVDLHTRNKNVLAKATVTCFL